MTPEFIPFPKIARLNREIIVTEKLDGTNSTIAIINAEGRPVPCAIADWTTDDGTNLVMLAGSRARWITPDSDNHGFAGWAWKNCKELRALGVGMHRGEWWGQGIQRGYGLKEKRWSLFNVQRWCLHGQDPGVASVSWDDKARAMVTRMQEPLPPCCGLVPVLYRGKFNTVSIEHYLTNLKYGGSLAAPGFMKPEGVVVWHTAANTGFKVTIENDAEPKTKGQTK